MYDIFHSKEERMLQYLSNVQILLFRFREWSVIHAPREENVEADELVNLGSSIEMKGINSSAVVIFSPGYRWLLRSQFNKFSLGLEKRINRIPKAW